MEELRAALRTFRESLADLDTVRQSSQSVADSQEVCTACACQHRARMTINRLIHTFQVYTELQEAITLTQAALDNLQSTEALKRSQQGTTDLATASAPASEPFFSPLVSSSITVTPTPITCHELPPAALDAC